MQKWLPIDNFPGYEVSNDGLVRNASNLYVLGLYDNGRGYLQVVMRKEGRNTARAVHRLVANAFHGEEPRDHVPVHLDEDKTNNHIDNLSWTPRWLAMQQKKQRVRTSPNDIRKIHMLSTNEVFENALECAEAIGGLEDMVLIAAQSRSISYKGSEFAFIRI